MKTRIESVKKEERKKKKMKGIILTDAITGEERIVEFEYPEILSEETETEILKRNFAYELAADEWIEKGLAELNIVEGLILKNDTPLEGVRLRAEGIEREKYISIKLLY